jgi:hypothetical protein
MFAEQAFDEDELPNGPADWLDRLFVNITELIRQCHMSKRIPAVAAALSEEAWC